MKFPLLSFTQGIWGLRSLVRLQPGLGSAQGSTGVRDLLPCSLTPQGCLMTQQLASTRVSVPREDTQDGSHRPFFFFWLKHMDVFFYITKTPESGTRQIQVSFRLPHNTTGFLFWLCHLSCVLFIARLVAFWLQNDCRTSRYHIYIQDEKSGEDASCISLVSG